MSVTRIATAQVESATSVGSLTLTVPAGVTTAHLGVISVLTVDATARTFTAPSWTARVANPAGAGNHAPTILTRLGGLAAGSTVTVTLGGATTGFTVFAAWYDTAGRDVASVGTTTTRGGTSGAAVTFAGVAVPGARDVLLVGTDRTAGTPTLSSWAPAAPTAPLYLTSTDRGTLAHGAIFADGSIAASGTTTTWTATLSASSGNASGTQLVLATPPVTASVVWQSETAATALSLGWVLSGGGSAQAVASTAADLSNPILGTSTAITASGWVNSRVTGLAENTLYYVGVRVDGVLIPTGRGSYRTLRTALAPSKVIAGSCNVTGSAHAVFTRIKGEAPDFFAHMGDIQYPTFNVDQTDAQWRDGFRSSVTSATFAPMLASVPMRYDPDNHDGPNANVGRTGADPWSQMVSSAVRDLTGEVYANSGKGFYKTWVHAGVRYIEIDRWSFRTSDSAAESSSKTMLGATQKAWLLDLFATATEPAIIVFGGFPNYSNYVTSGRWGSFRNEADSIGAAIAGLPPVQRNKIVFLGGDSHSVCADDGANAMWGRPSLNASPLNQSGGLASGNWNIANLDVADGRGYFSRLTFTPGGTALAMTWEAVQDDGQVMATWSTNFPISPPSKLSAVPGKAVPGALAAGAGEGGIVGPGERAVLRGSGTLSAGGAGIQHLGLVATYSPGAPAVEPTQAAQISAAAGDLLVLWTAQGNGTQDVSAPTGGGLVWTRRARPNNTGDPTRAHLQVWTAPVPADDTFTLSLTASGAAPWTWQLLRFAAAGGIGGSASLPFVGSVPALTVTTMRGDSALVLVIDDWAAIDGTARAWLTDSAGPVTETYYARDSAAGAFTAYAAVHATPGPPGDKTVGLLSPSGQVPAMAALEVYPTEAAVSGNAGLAGEGSLLASGRQAPIARLSGEGSLVAGGIKLLDPAFGAEFTLTGSGLLVARGTREGGGIALTGSGTLRTVGASGLVGSVARLTGSGLLVGSGVGVIVPPPPMEAQLPPLPAPGPIGSGRWSYTFVDTLTGKELATLPMTGVSFEDKINGAGAASGVVPVLGAEIRALNPWAATVPVRSSLYICYDDDPMWGGIVWSRQRAAGRLGLQIGAATFESFLGYCLLREDLSLLNATARDMVAVAVAAVQGAPGANIGLAVADNIGASPSLRTRNWLATDLRTTLELLTSFTTTTQPLEFRVEIGRDEAGKFTKTLLIGEPRLGARWTDTGMTVHYPGPLLSWTDTEDYSAHANAVAGTGSVPDTRVQTVSITGGPTGGTFTLAYGGQSTAALAAKAPASAVRAGLAALSTIAGQVEVSGSDGGPYTVTLTGIADPSLALPLAATSALTGGTAPGIVVEQSNETAKKFTLAVASDLGSDELEAGFPQITKGLSSSNTKTALGLSDAVNGALLDALAAGRTLSGLTLRPEFPALGGYAIGDDLGVEIIDPAYPEWPAPYVDTVRVTGRKVSVGEGTTASAVSLTVAPTAGRLPASVTLTTALREILARVTALETA